MLNITLSTTLFIFYIYTSRRLLKIGSIFQKKFKNSANLSEFCSLYHVAHRKTGIIFIMLFNYKDKIFSALIAEDAFNLIICNSLSADGRRTDSLGAEHVTIGIIFFKIYIER